MKRFLSVLLAIVICTAALSGCAVAEKLTAFGLYAKAGKDLSNGYEADMSITMELELFQLTIPLDISVRQNGEDSVIVTSMNGETISKFTTVDGYTYSDTAGVKVVTKRSDAPENDSSAYSSILPDLAENVFKSIEVVEEDGKKIITLSVDDEVATKLLQTTGAANDITKNATFENSVETMIFDENNTISEMIFSGDASFTEAGISVTVSINMTVKFKNVGSAPEITLPEDADEYIIASDVDE